MQETILQRLPELPPADVPSGSGQVDVRFVHNPSHSVSATGDADGDGAGPCRMKKDWPTGGGKDKENVKAVSDAEMRTQKAVEIVKDIIRPYILRH